MEKTLAIIKPRAFAGLHMGTIIRIIQMNGFTIDDIKLMTISKEQAELFYANLKDKPFFNNLIDNMASGTVVVLVLSKENAIEDFRKLIGATDPKKADARTIRAIFGESIDHNAIHGSDSVDNAKREIEILFS